MSKRPEQAALKAYPYDGEIKGMICENSRQIFIQGYEQSEKDTIERVLHYLNANLHMRYDEKLEWINEFKEAIW